MAKNDAAAADISIYMDIDADECPAGLDPVLWRRYNYTCGLRNMALAGMILVSLLLVPVAAVLLCRLPGPASASAPAADDEAGGDLPTMRQSVSVVWTVSLLFCSYLSFWIYTLSRTMGAAAVFLRISYGVTLAYAAAGLIGPAAGVAAAHLSTAWAAGLLGYALAEHRMHDGSEHAADEAAARAPPSLSEGQALTHIYCVFMSSLATLCMAARVVWLVFFPSYGEGNLFMIVLELSGLVWWILYFWANHMSYYLLHEALVSRDFILRLLFYYIGSIIPVGVVSGLLLGLWFYVYYFGLEMMAMAAFFGYILAVSERCKDILARNQPLLLKDLELGDVVQESASASTTGENT